jgi:ATP synthase protein I
MARGMRIGTEFVAAIVIGGILGYLIDLGLGTSPWGLLIMFMMGFAAGILNVTRAVAELNAASPPPPGPKPDAEDDKRIEH